MVASRRAALLASPRRAALLAATALVASGCSAFGGDEPEAVARPGTVTSAESGLRQGPYAIETSAGAVITFDLPTDPAPDQEVEKLRQDLRVEPVTYVAVHIDNTKGTRTVEISDLKVISHEGGLFPFETAAEVLAEWDPDRSVDGGFSLADGTDPGSEKGAELDRRTHELMASYPGTVPAGGTGEELLIGDFARLPATFDDVELTAYANERAEDPAPVGHGPEELRYRAQPGGPEVPEREPAEAAAPAPIAPEPVAPEPVAPEPVAPEPVAPEPVAPEPVAPEPLEGAGVAPEPAADDDVVPEPAPLPTSPAEAPASPPAPTLPIEDPVVPAPPPPGPGPEPVTEPTPPPSQEPTTAPLPIDPGPAPGPGPVLPETPAPTELPTAGNAPTTPTTPTPDTSTGASGPDPTASASAAPTVSASATPTVSASATASADATATAIATATAGATADPTSTSTPSPAPSATSTSTPSATPSATPSPAASLPIALEQA
ncbi:hypothetical protein [Kocuria dechangensis]|uniref:hypothetical protein n=1 Tax=Kocuria dechangensis TaxID=1176249 RepID=UPI00166B3571|nr:hypothetical protein [Kocuria dechangensis]